MSRRAAPLRDRGLLGLVALVVAGLLWLMVATEDQGQTTLSVPLTLTDPPAGLAVRETELDTVVLRLEGRRSQLTRLREEDFRAEVNLRDARPGRFVGPVVARNVSAPRGLRIVRVIPAELRLTLESR